MSDNDWEGYGTCPVCLAAPDEPCLDTDTAQEKAKAHRTRGVLTDDPIFQQGVKAARDAVKALKPGETIDPDGMWMWEEAVAAIDKLEDPA